MSSHHIELPSIPSESESEYDYNPSSADLDVALKSVSLLDLHHFHEATNNSIELPPESPVSVDISDLLEEEQFGDDDVMNELHTRLETLNNVPQLSIPSLDYKFSKNCYVKADIKLQPPLHSKFPCFCCGGSYLLSSLRLVKPGLIPNIQRLRSTSIPAPLMPYHFLPSASRTAILKNLIFEPASLQSDGQCYLCESCHDSLSYKKKIPRPPKLALANGLYTGPDPYSPPFNLPKLTWIEEMVSFPFLIYF